MTLDDVDGIAKGHFLRWADQTIGPARSVPMIRPAFRNDGLLRQFFFYACVFRTDAGKKKRAISAEMPQHDYHITSGVLCQLYFSKSYGFSVLYHISGSYLYEFPSCKRP